MRVYAAVIGFCYAMSFFAMLKSFINAAFDRAAMHSTRRALVEMQAEAAGPDKP
jgi:hypothetical protein